MLVFRVKQQSNLENSSSFHSLHNPSAMNNKTWNMSNYRRTVTARKKKKMTQRKRQPPHYHLGDKPDQHSFSSFVAQNLQKDRIAAIFQAKLMDLSAAASYVYQNPMHMPDTEAKNNLG
jgi:hypothetical protein